MNPQRASLINRKLQQLTRLLLLFGAVALSTVFFAPSISLAETPVDDTAVLSAEQQELLFDITDLDFSDVEIIANVNFYGGKIVSQKDNNFELEFILNNQDFVQPGIRYGVELIRRAADENSSDTVIDKKIYNEVVSLSIDDEITKKIQYQAPAFLSGEYYIQLVSYNTEGMMLALWLIDEPVTLNGNGEYVELSDCLVYVENVENSEKDFKADLLSGVDLVPGEELFVVCDAVNHTDTDLDFSAVYNFFGRTFNNHDTIKTETKTGFHLATGGRGEIKFPVNYVEKPQAYDVEIILIKDNVIFSNSIIAHYVIRGESATIQNIRLDKDNYKTGDRANLVLFLSGNAGQFPGTRYEEDDLAFSGALNILMKGEDGKICGEKNISLDNMNDGWVQDIDMDIKINCINPNVSFELLNSEGEMMYKTNVNVETKTGVRVETKTDMGTETKTGVRVTSVRAEEEGNIFSNWKYVVIIIITAIVLLTLIIALFRKKSALLILVLLFGGVCFFASPTPASATTYLFHSKHMGVTINWPAAGQYNIGSSATVQAGDLWVASCANLIFAITEVRCGINQTYPATILKTLNCDYSCSTGLCKICKSSAYVSNTFTVSDYGSHSLICAIHLYSYSPGGSPSWSWIHIGSVSLGCVPTCACAANTCVGIPCPNGCGGICPGTKNPGCACAANTCVGSKCWNGCYYCNGTKTDGICCECCIPDAADFDIPGHCVYDNEIIDRPNTSVHISPGSSMTLTGTTEITLKTVSPTAGIGDAIFIESGAKLILKD